MGAVFMAFAAGGFYLTKKVIESRFQANEKKYNERIKINAKHLKNDFERRERKRLEQRRQVEASF